MKLTVIIPSYNESNTLAKIIAKVKKTKLSSQIIVINDGSTDATKTILKKIKNIEIINNFQNMGKGFSIRKALKKVKGNYILIQDADLEYDPQDYQKLLGPIKKHKAEIVYGSRFTGEHRNIYFWNWQANKLLNFFTNILYNTTISDMEVGLKLIKTEIIKSLDLKANRFDFEPELTAKLLKNHHFIYEVPISYVGRTYAEGKKITAKDGLIAFWTLLKNRI